MKYDLIVVGAGVLGTFHAYHAARLGKKVLLLEKDPRQAGSSTQNFGQVVPSGLSKKWNRYGQRSLQIYKELQSITDLTIRNQGSVYIASDEEEETLIEELHQLHEDEGYEAVHLTKKGTQERFPDVRPEYIKSSLYYPQEISVNPLEMVNRLSNYLNDSGQVHVFYQKKVVGCSEGFGGCTVKTECGKAYEAEQIIICCGYTFEYLYPGIFERSGLVISKLQMYGTRPMAGVNLKANILTGLTIRRYESFRECPSYDQISTPDSYQKLQEFGIHILFKQESDGSVIIGDSHEYAGINGLAELGSGMNQEIEELLLKEAQRILPFDHTDITRKWAGFYSQCDEDIFIHYPEKHIQIVTGIGGKGMTSAAGFAEEMINKLYQVPA